MASFTITGFTGTAQTLVASENGYIAPSGQLVVTNADAIVHNDGSANVTVLGTIAVLGGNAQSQCIVTSGGMLNLIIGPDASLSSPGAGIFSVSDTVTRISNAGTIQSHTDGIIADSFSSGDFDLSNSGTIHGQTHGVRISFGITDAEIINNGTIFGRFDGVHATNTGLGDTLLLRNHGTIDSGTFGIQGGDSTDRIINSGTIGNEVVLAGGNDIYRNTGSGFVAGSVDGGDGDDILTGVGADDVFLGGDGLDLIRGRGGDDDISGGNQADTLYGGRGDDTVDGGGGADRINAGRGDDTVTGGGGADTFVIVRAADDDTITDFKNGVDRIDLTAFGLRDADYATIVAPALSNAAGGATFLDLAALGGTGSVLIEGLAFFQVNDADFIL